MGLGRAWLSRRGPGRRRFSPGPWRLKFAVDAQQLYDELYDQAAAEAEADTLGWLASAGYLYQALREENAPSVRLMSRVSGGFGILMVVQTLAWLASLGVDRVS